MLNLFIAVIISDFEKLSYDSQKQNIINMAQYSILVEELFPDFLLRKMRVDDELFICLHDLCREQESANCKGDNSFDFSMRRELWNIANGKPRNDSHAKRSLTPETTIEPSKTMSGSGDGIEDIKKMLEKQQQVLETQQQMLDKQQNMLDVLLNKSEKTM